MLSHKVDDAENAVLAKYPTFRIENIVDLPTRWIVAIRPVNASDGYIMDPIEVDKRTLKMKVYNPMLDNSGEYEKAVGSND